MNWIFKSVLFSTLCLSACTKNKQVEEQAMASLQNKQAQAAGNAVAAVAGVNLSLPPLFIVGATLAAADIEILADGGNAITERGICWGTAQNPTVSNSKVKHANGGLGKFRVALKNLAPNTTFFARAYAINNGGVTYSSQVSFKTRPKGNLTYTFNKSTNPTADELAAYARLQVAIDSAVWYINNYTSASRNVFLNYVPGVPTADANNEGWMRFGSNAGFQNLRTMLHELNHTLGTGTSSWWSSTSVNGKVNAPSANAVLKQILKDPNASLNGDTQHWWPFGLNQNSEVSSSWDYVYNCIIIEQMRKDGLTQFAGPYNP